MDYLLLLQCPYLAACIISATIQVCLMISHKKSKPVLMVTLTDMVTCDIWAIFLFSLYFALIPFVLPSVEFEWRPIIATFHAVVVTCLVLTFIFYILIKFLVEYFQVKLRVVDIIDEYKQEDVLQFIRLAIAFMVFSLSTWLHVTSGLSPLYYFTTETPVAPKSARHAVTVLKIIVFLSSTCLVLKFITRNEKRILLGQEREERVRKMSMWNFYLGVSILTFTFVILIGSLTFNGKSAHIVLRYIFYGLFCIVLPATVINRDKNLRRFSANKVQTVLKKMFLD